MWYGVAVGNQLASLDLGPVDPLRRDGELLPECLKNLASILVL